MSPSFLSYSLRESPPLTRIAPFYCSLCHLLSYLVLVSRFSEYTLRVRQAARLLRGSPEEMRRKIKKLARISGSEPPLSHLRLDIDHLNDLQYYNLDVYAFVIVTFSLLLILYFYFSVRIYRCVFQSKRKID